MWDKRDWVDCCSGRGGGIRQVGHHCQVRWERKGTAKLLDLIFGILDLSAEESVLRLEDLKAKDKIGELQPRRRGLELQRRFGLEF